RIGVRRMEMDRVDAQVAGDFQFHAQSGINAGEHADRPFFHDSQSKSKRDLVWRWCRFARTNPTRERGTSSLWRRGLWFNKSTSSNRADTRTVGNRPNVSESARKMGLIPAQRRPSVYSSAGQCQTADSLFVGDRSTRGTTRSASLESSKYVACSK